MKEIKKITQGMVMVSYTIQMAFAIKVSLGKDLGMDMVCWNWIIYKFTMEIGLMIKYKVKEK